MSFIFKHKVTKLNVEATPVEDDHVVATHDGSRVAKKGQWKVWKGFSAFATCSLVDNIEFVKEFEPTGFLSKDILEKRKH